MKNLPAMKSGEMVRDRWEKNPGSFTVKAPGAKSREDSTLSLSRYIAQESTNLRCAVHFRSRVNC